MKFKKNRKTNSEAKFKENGKLKLLIIVGFYPESEAL